MAELPSREVVPGSKFSRPVRGRNKKVSQRDRDTFLRLLAEGATVRQASEGASHPPNSFYYLVHKDPEFAEAKRVAMEIGTDVIEQEAFRRAVEGWDEPVFGKVAPGIDGEIGVVRKYDSRLMEVLLKGRRREYRDSARVEVTNQTLNVTVEDRSASLVELAEVLREAGVGPEQIAANGGGGVIEGVSAPYGVLAEPEDV